MKHLLITLEYPPQIGGVATYLSHLSEQFNPRDLLVIAPQHQNFSSFDSGRLHAIQRGQTLDWKRMIFTIRGIIRRNSVDHLITSHILPMGYVALAGGKPYTVILHGMDIRLAGKRMYKRWLTRLILNRAKVIVVNSHDTQAALQQFGDYRAKTVLAYPCPKPLDAMPVNTDREAQLKNLYFGDHEVILSVNRLVKRKGNDMVIKSLSGLREKHPSLRYVIVGSGVEKDYLLNLAKECNVEDMVIFAEHIDDSDLPYFYRNAKLFVQPARLEGACDVEGFGIVYLEAALFGIPSVAGNAGGAPEAVINGETGLVVDPNSTQEISTAIHQLLTDDELRTRFGEASKRRAQKEFTWKLQFGEYMKRIA